MKEINEYLSESLSFAHSVLNEVHDDYVSVAYAPFTLPRSQDQVVK